MGRKEGEFWRGKEVFILGVEGESGVSRTGWAGAWDCDIWDWLSWE
jgi:hypothetical protein